MDVILLVVALAIAVGILALGWLLLDIHEAHIRDKWSQVHVVTALRLEEEELLKNSHLRRWLGVGFVLLILSLLLSNDSSVLVGTFGCAVFTVITVMVSLALFVAGILVLYAVWKLPGVSWQGREHLARSLMMASGGTLAVNLLGTSIWLLRR
jgi:hypothetical protein